MSRNIINQFSDELAFVKALDELERKLQQFKSGNQAPTIQKMPISTLTGKLYASFSDAGGISPQFNAVDTLSLAGNRFVFSLPEFDLFNGTVLDAMDIFPEGSFFVSNSNAAAYIRFKYWYDLAGTYGTSTLVSRLTTFLDGALFNATNPPWTGNTFTLAIRNRYMQIGAT